MLATCIFGLSAIALKDFFIFYWRSLGRPESKLR
jgi:hypothetical protein